MRWFTITIIYCVIGLMGLVTARFNFYSMYMLQQKPISKLATLSAVAANCYQITLPKKQLFKDLSNLQWCDANTEVIFDGLYFEVISIDSSAQQVTLLVIEDEEESKLHRWFFGSSVQDENTDSEITNDLDIFFLANAKLKCFCIAANTIDYKFGNFLQLPCGYAGLPETPPRFHAVI